MSLAPVPSAPPAIVATTSSPVPSVPFFSQFTDISSPSWKKVGCGITSLAMIIDYYTPQAVSVNALLSEGVAAGAYVSSAGWSHAGLVGLAKKHGLVGNSYDFSNANATSSLQSLKDFLDVGPVIVSIHYKFDPKNPIPHMVVVDAIQDGFVYYNDPAAKAGQQRISISAFQKSWKKRLIAVRPTAASPISASGVL